MITNFFSIGQIANRRPTIYITRDNFENLSEDNREKGKVYSIIGENESWKYVSNKWQKASRNDYAYYHTFVLGDSGISKFIKARRYGSQEIIDGLYDVFI